MKEHFFTHQGILFKLTFAGFGIIMILASVWLDTFGQPEFYVGSIFVITGLIVAFIPVFRKQQLSHWSLKPHQFFIPLLLCAALMNGFLFVNNPNMGGDAMLYHSAFHNLMSGIGWYEFDGSWAQVDPGYGMLSYLFFLIFRDIEFSGMIVSSLAYLLMIPTVFCTAHSMFGKKVAFLASVSIAFFPVLVSYSHINLSDCVFTFFLFLSFSLFSKILLDKATVLTHALLGVSLGLAYLIRAVEGLLVAGLVIIYLLVQGVIKMKRTTKEEQSAFRAVFKTQIPPLATSIMFATIALPFIIIFHTQTGFWTFSARIMPIIEKTSLIVDNEVISSTPTGKSNATDTVIVDPQMDPRNTETVIVETPQTQTYRMSHQPNIIIILKNTPKLIRGLVRITSFAFIPLALLCTAFPFLSNLSEKELFVEKIRAQLRPAPRRTRKLLSLAIFSSPVLIHLSVGALHTERWLMQYSIYLLIFIACLTASFLESILKALKWKHIEIWVILLCLITVAASFGLTSPTLFSTLANQHCHLGLRAAGFWIKDHEQEPTDIKIMAPGKGPVALFYANGGNFAMGNRLRMNSMSIETDIPLEETLKNIGEVLNSGGVDYLVLDNCYTHTKGDLWRLWDNPDLAQIYGYSLLHQDSDGLFQIYIGDLNQ